MEVSNEIDYRTEEDVVENYKLIPLIARGELELLKKLKWKKNGAILNIFSNGLSNNGDGNEPINEEQLEEEKELTH